MSDERVISIRLPEAILELVDATVEARLYKSRTEVLREVIRNGVNHLMYNGCGGFCFNLKQMVDCCHDKQCSHYDKCRIYSK